MTDIKDDRWKYWKCAMCGRVDSYPPQYNMPLYCSYGHMNPKPMFQVKISHI